MAEHLDNMCVRDKMRVQKRANCPGILICQKSESCPVTRKLSTLLLSRDTICPCFFLSVDRKTLSRDRKNPGTPNLSTKNLSRETFVSVLFLSVDRKSYPGIESCPEKLFYPKENLSRDNKLSRETELSRIPTCPGTSRDCP